MINSKRLARFNISEVLLHCITSFFFSHSTEKLKNTTQYNPQSVPTQKKEGVATTDGHWRRPMSIYNCGTFPLFCSNRIVGPQLLAFDFRGVTMVYIWCSLIVYVFDLNRCNHVDFWNLRFSLRIYSWKRVFVWMNRVFEFSYADCLFLLLIHSSRCSYNKDEHDGLIMLGFQSY